VGCRVGTEQGRVILFPTFAYATIVSYMSGLLNSIPYILAGATVFLGVFQLIKEWDEYEKLKFPWLRKAVLVALVLIGALTFVSLYLDNKAKAEEKNKSDGDIRELKAKVQAANDAQSDNTKLFVDSFGAMSKEVSNLKAEVKTEELQKKLASVQADLVKTQKAMAPGPKAELTFSFVPFQNPPSGSIPVSHVILQANLDGSVHVEFAVMNHTVVDATNIELDIQICDNCKYAKEPAGLTRTPGAPDTIRTLHLDHLLPRSIYETISLDIIPPSNSVDVPVGFNYRCSTCILPTSPATGTFRVLRR
jgi:hypothetical protein